MAQIFGHASDLKNGEECTIEVDQNTILYDFVLKIRDGDGKVQLNLAMSEKELKRLLTADKEGGSNEITRSND